jgi:hypothetical protein
MDALAGGSCKEQEARRTVAVVSGQNRRKLYIRQTYTTPGIYIKTTAFALRDQIRETNPEWGGGFEGFAKRLGSRQAQFIMKNL